mgnify:CR=1 FL=1
MQEKIGNVVIQTQYYPGQDLYSDGEIEDRMLKIAQKYGDIEYSSVIAEEKSWPILYHFSHVRENIVNWLPITKKDHVLEIGSGCGAITGTLAEQAGQVQCIELSKKRSMINAYRHREKTNINILLGNFEEIEPNLVEKYDWITLIGVFEYSEKYIGTSEPYKEMLLRTKRHLKPNGKIVIAIENRLGLKYWAGCTEDHVGKYFEGIEGYANTEGIKTFSRKELENIIRKTGNWKIDFYYPYPDYKFPREVFTDESLKEQKYGLPTWNFTKYRMALFREGQVAETIQQDGRMDYFASSR